VNITIIPQVYCLPDGYEVEDRSLEVIRYVLNPTFKHEEVSCSLKLYFVCWFDANHQCLHHMLMNAQICRCHQRYLLSVV